MKSTLIIIFSFVLALSLTIGFYFLCRYEIKMIDEGNYWWWYGAFLNIPFYPGIYYAWKWFFKNTTKPEKPNNGYYNYDID